MMFLTQFLQEGPAQTTGYMIAGYVIIFGTMAVYLVSLVLRRRSLDQDLEVLDEIQRKTRGR
jgi:hypothetical protein